MLGAVRYWKRLEEARGLVTGAGRPSTGVTIAHISFNISQHAFLVIPIFEEPVSLVSARVGSRDLIMNFPDQVGAEVCNVRNNYLVLVQKNTRV